MKLTNTHHLMTTKSSFIFKHLLAIITSLSVVGCSSKTYNYEPLDPYKKIEYDRDSFHEERILKQDGKIVNYDDVVKLLSGQEYSKENINKNRRKQTIGTTVGLTGSAVILAVAFGGLNYLHTATGLLAAWIGVSTQKSGRNDVLKAVDQHNTHIEQSNQALDKK